MLPSVQSTLARNFVTQINQKTGVKIDIDKIQITPSGRIILKNFIAKDVNNDTIFYGKRLNTYIQNIANITQSNSLILGKTNIDGLVGKIIYYKGEKDSNLDKFIKQIEGEKSSEKNTSPFKLLVEQISLINSKFAYYNYNNIDRPKILDFKYLHADLEHFLQHADTVSFKLNQLQALDYTGIQIQNLTTDFQYNRNQITFQQFKLDTDYSTIDMNLRFLSPKGGYSDFYNNIQLSGTIEEAYLSTNDLEKLSSLFAPGTHFSVSSQIKGTLNKMKLINFESLSENGMELDGNITLKNTLSHPFSINADIKKLNFSFKKFQEVFPDLIPNIPKELYLSKNINVSGKFNYENDKIKTKVQINTELGKILTDVSINELSDLKKTNYTGHIQTFDFQLQHLINEDIKDINSNFNIKGKGLLLSSLNANFIGDIKKLTYNNYQYKNISTSGIVKKSLFQGEFSVSDPNLEMDFTGLLDFSHKTKKLDFSVDICNSNLYELNFSKDELARLETFIDLQITGSNLDDIIGKIKIQNLKYRNQYNTYTFKDFLITSEFIEEQERLIEFHSTDAINGYLKGNFKFKQIPLMLQNAMGSVFVNFIPQPIEENQYIQYKIHIYNKLIEMYNPDLKVSENTLVSGKISSIDNNFRMKLISPQIDWKDKKIKNINLRIDNKNPLYNIFLKIDSVDIGFYKLNHFRLLNTTINDTLYLKTKFNGKNVEKDKYDISFYYTMDEMKNFIFGFKKSLFQFKGIPWEIHPNMYQNKIFYNLKKDSLAVKDIAFTHRSEKVLFSGFDTPNKLLFNTKIDSIQLSHITPDLNDFIFDGLVNGNVQIHKIENEYLPSASLNINNFKLNDVLLGDLTVKINTLRHKNVFVDLIIKKDGIQPLRAIGYIDLNKNLPVVNASLVLEKFPVKILQPVFQDIFGNIRGNLTGTVQITGKIDDLSYDGKIYLNNFGFKVLVLNTDYQFNDRSVLWLKNSSFELKDAHFFDTKEKSTGKISGVIKHHNFENWYLDLSINSNNILALDTPANPHELFYGKVFVGGNTHIHGYVNKLKIDANMQTKRNTKFVITLTESESLEENDFVRIISKQTYKKEKDRKKIFKVYEGVEMNFDLDITPDAEVEILLDQEFGSTLVAKGSGAMYMEANTDGRFNLWGDFTVLEGIYNFKYGGLIDKKFKVEPGSYVSWEGDPYDGNLDIKAVYETFADPSVLLTDTGIKTQKTPVKVVVYLKEKLMHPTITFDLELPKANAILRSQVEYALSDPDKKTLQVLSLLSFGNFINENEYNLGIQAAEGAVKTISERGLNILNALIGQDDKFQINLNYTGGESDINRNIVTDPQVGLSLVTKINKRVYINGKVAVPVGRYTKSSIVGDVELEVYLDDKGNLIFRVFNKQTELEYIGQQEGYTQGIGISYQVDFNTFKDILQNLGISIETK